MSDIAKDFLTRCFAPSETIALLLRNESTATTQQRVVPLERALAPRYRGWLAYENHNGANIYVAANPLLSGLLAGGRYLKTDLLSALGPHLQFTVAASKQ